MASQVTTFWTNQQSVATAGIQNRSTDQGKVFEIVDSFTTTSALTAGSHTLVLCKLPANCKVTSVELIVPASVGTSSAKIGTFAINADGTLGAAIDDDAYGAGVSLATAGRVQFVTAPADADRLTTVECALVLSPVTTNFATAILFTFIVRYTVGN